MINKNNWRHKKIINNIFNIIEILIISGILILTVVLPILNIFRFNNDIFINYFYIVILIPIQLLISNTIGLILDIILISSIFLTYILEFGASINFFAYLSIHMGLILLILISTYIFKLIESKKIKTFNLSLIFIICVIILLINAFEFQDNSYWLISFISFGIIFLFEIIFVWFLQWYISFLKHIEKLDKQKLYEKYNFYNYEIAKEKIKFDIKNKNIKYGLVMIFDYFNINRLSVLWGNNKAKFIKKAIISELTNSFKNIDTTFFVTNKNEYACFINLKNINLNKLNSIYKNSSKQIRPIDDPLSDLQTQMLNIPKIISYEDKKQKINSGAYASIYGIHSCDIDELLNLSNLTKMKSNNNKNTGIILDIYNPSIVNKYGSNTFEEIYDNQYINPNTIEIIPKKCKINNFEYIDFNISSINNLLINFDEIRSFTLYKNIYEKTVRLIAMECLKKIVEIGKYKNFNIMINYPIKYVLSDEFDLRKFKNKINFLNIKLNNLIINFDVNDLNNIDEYSLNNLEILKQNGCKIMFSKFGFKNLNILKKCLPTFINVDENNILKNDIKLLKDSLKKFNVIVN